MNKLLKFSILFVSFIAAKYVINYVMGGSAVELTDFIELFVISLGFTFFDPYKYQLPHIANMNATHKS
jgi:hypothetical protein